MAALDAMLSSLCWCSAAIHWPEVLQNYFPCITVSDVALAESVQEPLGSR